MEGLASSKGVSGGNIKRKLGMTVKRAFDAVVSFTMLVMCLPLMVLIAVAIKLNSPGPTFFRQQRAGLQRKLFWIYKFRSMVTGADRTGPVISLNDPRVTRVGRFLRLISLDELPQLINVLRGEMSLVGPRPLMMESLKPEEMRRLELKPGITGLTVVSGRQSLSWDQRMNLDLWYIDHWSLWLDFSILLRTISVVLSRENVYDRDGEMKGRQ